jgi:hypothetical protein
VRRFICKLRGGRPPEPLGVIIITAPREEAQVDYGEGPMVCEVAIGK